MAKGKEPKPESKKKATKTLIEKRKEKQEKKANKQYFYRYNINSVCENNIIFVAGHTELSRSV